MRRLVFGDGLPLADAVYSGSGGEGQAAHAVAAHAFEHVIGAEGVLPQIFIGGVSGNELDVRIGGQVIDHIDAAIAACQGGFQGRRVQQVAFDETEAGTADQVGDVFPLAAAEIVDDGDLAAMVEQGCGEVRADAARSAGDECVGGHGRRGPRAGPGGPAQAWRPAPLAACSTSVQLKVWKAATRKSRPSTARCICGVATGGRRSPPARYWWTSGSPSAQPADR